MLKTGSLILFINLGGQDFGAMANSPMQRMHDEQQYQQRGYENDHAFPCIHAR